MEIASQPIQAQATHRNDLLKIIAIATMLIDHVGYLYFPGQMLYRTIGRIAFPIFAYQVALGFQKTSNRKKYGLRLLIFACISQIPYFWFNPDVQFRFGGLNIMFTFLLALGALQCFEMGQKSFRDLKVKLDVLVMLKTIAYWMLCFTIIIAPEITRIKFGHGVEYGMSGILFVFLFYFLGKVKAALFIGYVGLSAFSVYYTAARGYYMSVSGIMNFFEAFTSYKGLMRYLFGDMHYLLTLDDMFFQSRSIMAVPIIWIGNYIDTLSVINIRLNKFVGYWFYPVHISLLLLMKVFIF